MLIGILFFTIILVYTIDFAHYAYLSQRLNASVLTYLEDAAISTAMVWQSYPVIWILLGLAVGTYLVIYIMKAFHRRLEKPSPKSSRIKVTSWYVLVCVLLLVSIFGRLNQYPLRWSDAFELGDDYKAQLALNPFESFFNTLRYRHSNYDANKLRAGFPLLSKYFNLNQGNDSLNFRRYIVPADTQTIKPNVVIVLCESFSAYKSSMWGNPLNTTPFFDSLSKSGIFFDNCFSPTYGTARGVWALITGIPDVEIANTASRNPAYVNQHSIINDFSGYSKYYFIGGSASWANIRGLLTNNISGLKLYEEEDFKAGRIDVWGISDKNLLIKSSKILAKESKPFFAVIQTADNHRPYTIPGEDAKEFEKKNFPKDTVLKYGFESNDEMNAFRYTDFSFRKFMEAAQKESYYNNTIFVFIGDHGIAGNAGTMFPSAWTDQRLTAVHVPLLFYSPSNFKGQRIRRTASQIDVLPTVAGLCKIPYLNSTLGRDLLDSSFFQKDLAFLFDPDSRMIGLVKDSFYYRKSFTSARSESVSLDKSLQGGNPDTKEMDQLTDAIFEASKFLLLNNKKP